MITSRKTRLLVRKAYRILVGNLKEREHMEDIGLDGRIKWILRKQDMWM
jgi:hypothetical protein